MQIDCEILDQPFTIEFEVNITTRPEPPTTDYLDGGDPGVDLAFEITAAEVVDNMTPDWLASVLVEYLQENPRVAEMVSAAVENGEL